jgi:hypothetical protein
MLLFAGPPQADQRQSFFAQLGSDGSDQQLPLENPDKLEAVRMP